MTTTTLITLTLMLLILAMLRNMRGGETKSGAVLKHESLAAHYRPMLRLLDESDCGFMAAQLEGKASLRRLRAERRSLFRLYLRELRADHARIVRAIRELLVQSEIDRPDLCQALHRCQFLFALAMASINYKLLLHTFGLGSVDVRSLVTAVDALQLQLQDMIFIQAVARA